MVNCHFALGAIIMLILFGILFYLSTILESKYDIHGIWKGCVLAIPLLVLSLSSYMAGKNWNNQNVMKKCIYIGFNGVASVIIPLFIKGIYLLLLCLVIMGIGIGMALPCLDALITQGIERSKGNSYVILQFNAIYRCSGWTTFIFFFMKGRTMKCFI